MYGIKSNIRGFYTWQRSGSDDRDAEDWKTSDVVYTNSMTVVRATPGVTYTFHVVAADFDLNLSDPAFYTYTHR